MAKVIQYDLRIVQSFAPDVLQLGTNDLQTISAVEPGSALEDLTRLFYESKWQKHLIAKWITFNFHTVDILHYMTYVRKCYKNII